MHVCHRGSTNLTLFCYHFPEAKDMPISTIQTLKLLQLVRTGMVKMDDKVNHIASQVRCFLHLVSCRKSTNMGKIQQDSKAPLADVTEIALS